jgi:hypothetical protein
MRFRRSQFRSLGALLLLLAPTALPALPEALLDIAIKGRSRAGPPEYVGQQVLFSYQADRPVRLVGARFAHESYQVFHTYVRNDQNVFVLLLDLPRDARSLRYRIVVDGLWMRDPFNPSYEQDALGQSFSVFPLDGRPIPTPVSPEVAAGGRVTFRFQTVPGQRVYVMGDFNNWDPFWDPLKEARPGQFLATLRLTPGPHYYLFAVNGRAVPDPLNLSTAQDPEGRLVSSLNVPAYADP